MRPIDGLKCLKDFQTTDVTSTSLSVNWKYECHKIDDINVSNVKFKLYYNHDDFLSCSDKSIDSIPGPGRGVFEIKDEYGRNITGLHPYSIYRLSVKALPIMVDGSTPRGPPEELELEAETLSGIPEVRPLESGISTKIRETSLRFYWRAPPPSECSYFFGLLDGYEYILKGIDRWNVNAKLKGETHKVTEEFKNLQPNSRYMLFVYARNSMGETNKAGALKLEAKTSPSKVPLTPPRDLTVEPLEDRTGFRLHWLPPYPPSTTIQKYQIRYKPSNAQVWTGTFRADPGNSLCPEEDIEKDFTCFSIAELHENNDERKPLLQNVTFQVAGISSLLGRSPWSPEVTSTLLDPDDVVLGGHVILVAIVVGALMIFMLILLIIFLWHRRQKQNYKNVPQYEPSKASSVRGVNNEPTPNNPASYYQQESVLSNSTNSSLIMERNSIALSSFGSKTNRQSLPIPSSPLHHNNRPASLDVPKVKGVKDYSHLVLPIKPSPNSIQGTPLPPVPGKEPVYEELCQDTLLRRPFPIGSGECVTSAVDGGGANNDGDSDDEFLKPTDQSDCPEEDNYLKPRNNYKKITLTGNLVSDNVEDEEEDGSYLKPTFNQMEFINTRDMSPPQEKPPPIPIESYTPLERKD